MLPQPLNTRITLKEVIKFPILLICQELSTDSPFLRPSHSLGYTPHFLKTPYTYRDKHTPTLEPRATAPAEGQDEGDDAGSKTEGVSGDDGVLVKEGGVPTVGQSQPQPHAQHRAPHDLKRDIYYEL